MEKENNKNNYIAKLSDCLTAEYMRNYKEKLLIENILEKNTISVIYSDLYKGQNYLSLAIANTLLTESKIDLCLYFDFNSLLISLKEMGLKSVLEPHKEKMFYFSFDKLRGKLSLKRELKLDNNDRIDCINDILSDSELKSLKCKEKLIIIDDINLLIDKSEEGFVSVLKKMRELGYSIIILCHENYIKKIEHLNYLAHLRVVNYIGIKSFNINSNELNYELYRRFRLYKEGKKLKYRVKAYREDIQQKAPYILTKL